MKQVGLTINEEKSQIVYIDTFPRWNVATSFTFLGYDFKVRTLKNFKGELYRKCMPGASEESNAPDHADDQELAYPPVHGCRSAGICPTI